jgi:SAM-dependent methyltransferase
MDRVLQEFCNETSAGFLPSPTLSALNVSLRLQDELREKFRACAACGSAAIRAFSVLRGVCYHRCTKCGFTFANPAPSDNFLAKFYNSSFYNNYRKLEADRIPIEPYFSISSYTDFRRLAGWLDKERPVTILDFGCGPGSFLALLRDKFGFEDVDGLEINAESAAIAKRNYGLHLASDISELRHKQYDLVVLHEVIEHVAGPDELLSLVGHLTKPGGRLLITTPSVRNYPARLFPSHCGHYVGPNHISLFTESAISEILSRFAFRIERMEIDICDQLIGNFVLSPVYDLDFASPRSDDDFNDLLFVPNRLGRALGLTPTRSPGRFGKALQRLDNLAARLARTSMGVQKSDHLYVLARKAETT